MLPCFSRLLSHEGDAKHAAIPVPHQLLYKHSLPGLLRAAQQGTAPLRTGEATGPRPQGRAVAQAGKTPGLSGLCSLGCPELAQQGMSPATGSQLLEVGPRGFFDPSHLALLWSLLIHVSLPGVTGVGLQLQQETLHAGTKQESREHLLPLPCLGARRNNLPLRALSQHLAVAQEKGWSVLLQERTQTMLLFLSRRKKPLSDRSYISLILTLPALFPR